MGVYSFTCVCVCEYVQVEFFFQNDKKKEINFLILNGKLYIVLVGFMMSHLCHIFINLDMHFEITPYFL